MLLIIIGAITTVLGCIGMVSAYDQKENNWFSKLYWSYHRWLFGRRYLDAGTHIIYGIVYVIVGLGLVVLTLL